MRNYLDINVRRKILGEILSTENINRKKEAIRKMDFYKKNQAKYIIKALYSEFDANTVNEMRKITSINLTKKIVNELASIYKSEPDREFYLEGSNIEGTEIEAQIHNLYKYSEANAAFKKANKYFKLFNQCTMQVLPKGGELSFKVLAPQYYDVVPRSDDISKAEAYVISSYNATNLFPDFSTMWSGGRGYDLANPPSDSYSNYNGNVSDKINQLIADKDDSKGAASFIWWTDDFHFVTDKEGNIISSPEDVENPIKKLPFIDVVSERDFEYWTDEGQPLVDFAVDFGVLLSDVSTINRMQGYSQAVIYSEERPASITVGHNRVMHLKLDKNSEVQPKFEFATPSPDLNASLALMETMLRLFLTDNNIDPKAISGTGDGAKYTSGVERLLAMIEKLGASDDDIEEFKTCEQEVFEIFKLWSNKMQDDLSFNDNLKLSVIPENVELVVNYAKPSGILTQTEIEDSVIKRQESGLISRSEAIAELRNIDMEKARNILVEIDSEKFINVNDETLNDINETQA